MFVTDHNLTAFTETGDQLWTTSLPFAGTIVYQSPDITLTRDDFRIVAYEHKPLQPWPQDQSKRQTLVQAQVSDWPLLDEPQRKHLQRAKEEAFAPFLKEFLIWTIQAQRADAPQPEGVYDGKGFYYMSFMAKASHHLAQLFTPSQTDHLIQTWKSLPDDHPAKPTLESLLNEKADPKTYIPLLIQKVTNIEDIPEDQAVTIDVLSQSNHPDAVDFMISALDNTKADPSVRNLAFTRLVGTGGVKGLEAVKRWRQSPRPITPWYERIDLDQISEHQSVAENTGSNGNRSILFTADHLANPDDLYYAQKSNGQWSRPYWTGIQHETGVTAESKKYKGFTIAEILAGKWIDLFAHDPDIRQDSDQDGLTDMDEARLRTNPQDPDSDHDGMRDNGDPVPSAATGQNLSDEQKIFAAVIEATHFASQPETCPQLIHFPEVTPFEFYGFGAPSVWQREDDTLLNPLSTAKFPRINLTDPDYFSGKATDSKRIRYSEDKMSARTTLSYSRGSFAYGNYFELKKIDDQWYVTNSQFAYIS